VSLDRAENILLVIAMELTDWVTTAGPWTMAAGTLFMTGSTAGTLFPTGSPVGTFEPIMLSVCILKTTSANAIVKRTYVGARFT